MTDEPDDKMLCYCKNLRYGAVRRAIADGRLKSVEQVTAACTAGGGCRSCRPEIEALLAEFHKKPVDSGPLAWLKRFVSRSRGSA